MRNFSRGDVFAAACPSRQILQHVTSRWGGLVLIALREETLRFAQLRRRIDGISERMLAQTLQVLEGDGLILRKDYGEVPPRVDYTLTPAGREISARVFALSDWIEKNLPELLALTPDAAPQTVQ
ncbi:HxlR family transcriptional regulator [Rhodobacter aestuarii]|uniref:Transcriptional regulator, HxlR family n=1 Tax=Rhodobacter aestuarii TaxID=453582 RepID=A0A1N7PHS5_9RHOB|nr:helix-turn-helix domain-containing protein [Rhodobacter aestuarii]PTV94409.1 HxlR family transcriptional regulator [Rhodobacter aestuarii]SIT10077.1 transcriptional regulator, HxlR family [Rhodobacter aestuarii]